MTWPQKLINVLARRELRLLIIAAAFAAIGGAAFAGLLLPGLDGDETTDRYLRYIAVAAVGLALLTLVVHLLTSLRRRGHRGFRRLENGCWRDYFTESREALDKDASTVEIDMSAHSLWCHFMPKEWASGSKLGEYRKAIHQLEMAGCLWTELLVPWLEDKSHECVLRVLIISPTSHQSRLVSSQQRVAHEGGRDKHREAREDGIRTLYVLRILREALPSQLRVKAFVLREQDRTMTYSLCRVNDHVLVGHYSYRLLSHRVPCSVFNRVDDKVGEKFCEEIHDLLVSERDSPHSDLVPLDEAPRSPTYEEFRAWIKERLREADARRQSAGA